MKKFLLSLILFLTSAQNSFATLGPIVLLSSGSMTGTSTLSTDPMDALEYFSASFEANWTGTPTGTFIVEGSNDASVWTNIGASGWTNPAGAAAGILVNTFGLGFRYVRLTYTNASGTGSLSVIGMAK